MPLVLSQHYLETERMYDDVEGALYHYPAVYFGRVKPYAQFVYYRPLGRATRRPDSKTYFGHGTLGTPYEDWRDPSRRFVDIIQYEPFPHLVALNDLHGNYYETGTPSQFQAQAAVRDITDASTTLPIAASGWPIDAFRRILEIPPGAGYIPRSDQPPNVYESAALQERARADHQRVLASIASVAQGRGGATLYNNNVDLFVSLGPERILVEAKSLNDPSSAVDRMRYGMGQLLDYSVRYRADLAGATPMLAFGRPPNAETSWIACITRPFDLSTT